MRRILVVAVLLAVAALAAACGGEPIGPSSATLDDGTQVSAQRYLADSDEAAAAVGAFSAELERLGPVARAEPLAAAAPALEDILERARTALGRLSAQRLEDARLERQRAVVVPLLQDVVSAMEALTAAAVDGRPVVAAEASERFARAVQALRESRAPA